MYLDTILSGLNGLRSSWNHSLGRHENTPVLGRSCDIAPFLRNLGWGVEDTSASYGDISYGRNRYNLITDVSRSYDLVPIQLLFYTAKLTPGEVVEYTPLQTDKEKLIELAHNKLVNFDPFCGYLINTYNKAYPKLKDRIKLKDLNSSWEFTEPYNGVKYLFNREARYIYLNPEQKSNHIRAVQMVVSNEYFHKCCAFQEQAVVANEAPCEILNYSTKVEKYINTDTSKNNVLFGIELELEGHTQARLEKSHELLKKHCIFKRDGSIHNGMEIVSRPATVQEHKEVFKKFFDANLGYKADSNCGIHIHASRGKMSFLQLGRIHAFLSNNKGSVVKIAGRESTYAKFDASGNVLTPWYKISGDKYVSKKRFSWDKYTAVNLAPENTMEFRIFKSTTNWDEFCRFLEFPDALISYCSLAGNDNKGKIRTLKDLLMFSNFKDFVASRGSAYPSLNKFIQAECI